MFTINAEVLVPPPISLSATLLAASYHKLSERKYLLIPWSWAGESDLLATAPGHLQHPASGTTLPGANWL